MHSFHSSLDPLFCPRSVAVVGASATPGSVGSILIHNLLENPFAGVVYPVNPKRFAVHGVRCYSDLASVPELVDLAVIATPAATVPNLIGQCADLGIPGAIIISAGFSELGSQGKALESKILDAARSKVRIIGPNCLGVIRPPTRFNASFACGKVTSGRVALLSQSGAICTSILDWAAERHMGFSAFVSVGSMLDVDFADLIDYFAEDEATRSIILYMESIGDVRKFLSATRSVSRTKHVIVVKAGRHEAGARAAASHTGALAGSDAVFEAAFRRAGILRVATIPELFDLSEILALQPAPRGPSLAIVTNAGGPGVMATDALMLAGGQLAALAPSTLAALDAALPPFWSHANPVDVLGDATPERYRVAVQASLKDPAVHGLLILLTPQAMTDPTETAQAVAAVCHGSDKPVLACWMGGATVRPGRDVLSRAGIPTFDAPEPAVGTFLHMVEYRRNQDLLYETPPAIPSEGPPTDVAAVSKVFARTRAAERTLLTESEAKEALIAYGLSAIPALACRDAIEAVAAATQTGFPVVVKLLSTTLTHKSDVGGVQLNLADANAVRTAFTNIRASFVRLGRAEAFEGVTVQPMVHDKGLELIVGSSVDQQFGPVILFGAGGVLVETLRDSALALPPLNRTLARRLMERTRIYPALKGVRGREPVNLEALETLLVRFSQFLIDFPEVAEVDMNPVLATRERVVALDARILLAPSDAPRPRLAIHPFPNQYMAPFTLRNGLKVIVRALGPEDEPLIVAMHGRHSEHTLRMRYFGLVKTLSHDSLIRLCHLDYDREMALTAVTPDGQTMLGVSRYYLKRQTAEAEFALIVSDAYQRQGLGRHLLERLIAVARERCVRKLIGLVLAENSEMLNLVRSLAFREPKPPQDGVAMVELSLC